MAGTELATKDAKSTAVATYDFGADAGLGFENVKPGDFKPSFLKVLQSNSPQVVNELPGAKAGLWCDSITNEFFPTILYIPAVREHVYVAWKPRTEGGGEGQGFGGVFKLDDPMVVKQLGTIENKFERGDDGKLILPRTPDGEFQLVETMYFHGIQILEDSGTPVPVTVPFFSTGLPVAGNYFSTMYRHRIPPGQPGAGQPYPLFSHVTRLGSQKVTKKGNTWYVPTYLWGGENPTANGSLLDPNGDYFKAARSVAVAFKEGNAKVDYAASGGSEAGAAKGGGADKEIPF
jgi:hypothetical protein